MSTPGGGVLPPEGSFQLGSGFGQAITEGSGKNALALNAITAYSNVQNKVDEELRVPTENARLIAVAAQGSADQAVTDSQAALNAAQTAESTAASASDRASYWESEFVVASAAVVLGDNELLIGLCQNVPGGLTRTITDMHVALLSQPNGMTFELKKWNSTGTVASVLGTYSLAAGVIRANWADLGFVMSSRERVYLNVAEVTGTDAPNVLQVLLFGVME
ncbi:hypothetical protein [Nocardia wallacei]|uniref:hypothetical protein n=1 Tax=Nocardia wallacei TaxID=480035 RepID=UPI002458225F|nr:hypothetical protein [Nocardia wallacei]